MAVIVTADAGTTYTFDTAEYWEEVGGQLLVYGTHGSEGIRVLETFDTWVNVAFSE